MSTEQATAFIEKLNSDESFRNQVADAGSKEALLQMAKESGLQLSPEDLNSIIEQFSSEELSEDELDAVAGGVIDGVFKFLKVDKKLKWENIAIDKSSPL